MNSILSDLFFNHTHPNYDKCLDNDDVNDTVLREAILVDAQEFVNHYSDVIQLKYSAEEYADDFIRRL